MVIYLHGLIVNAMLVIILAMLLCLSCSVVLVQSHPIYVLLGLKLLVSMSSMLFPYSKRGVPLCPALCCFPTQGSQYYGVLYHFRSDDTYTRKHVDSLTSNRYYVKIVMCCRYVVEEADREEGQHRHPVVRTSRKTRVSLQ